VDEAANLEDHFSALLAVIGERVQELRAVSAHEETAIWMTVVRRFEDGDEDFDESTYGVPADMNLSRLGGQHPFLGWGLDAANIDLLSSCGIGLDVDEYG